MDWNPIKKLREKFAGGAEKPPQATTAEMEKAASAMGGSMPDLKELEKQGMMGKFFRHWKNPAFMKQMKAVAARMAAEGVNVKDQKAVQAWIEKNKALLMSGKLPDAPENQKPVTIVNDGPQIGRNDPCNCGSGKKYKKCCAKG